MYEKIDKIVKFIVQWVFIIFMIASPVLCVVSWYFLLKSTHDKERLQIMDSCCCCCECSKQDQD